MAKQGGGVTSHAGATVYVDLVVEDLGSIEAEYPQTSGLFAAFAKLAKDNRLSDALSVTAEGAAFYERLHRAAPVITVSRKILGDPSKIANVRNISTCRLGARFCAGLGGYAPRSQSNGQ